MADGVAKSAYLAEMVLGWVTGKPFSNPPQALFLSLHTADPDFSGAGEADAFGMRKRAKIELVNLGVVKTPSNRFMLTNTATLELGEVKSNLRDILYLGVWDAETIGQGNLLFYSKLGQARTLVPGDRVTIPAQSFSLEEA